MRERGQWGGGGIESDGEEETEWVASFSLQGPWYSTSISQLRGNGKLL